MQPQVWTERKPELRGVAMQATCVLLGSAGPLGRGRACRLIVPGSQRSDCYCYDCVPLLNSPFLSRWLNRFFLVVFIPVPSVMIGPKWCFGRRQNQVQVTHHVFWEFTCTRHDRCLTLLRPRFLTCKMGLINTNRGIFVRTVKSGA